MGVRSGIREMSTDRGEGERAIRPWRSHPLTIWLYLIGALGLGVTAFFSGGMMLLDPSGATMGLELEWLDGTLFQNYFIPGLVLFSVLGVGSFVVLYGIGRRRRWGWWAAIGLGIALVGWISTQVVLLQMNHVLQVIYRVLGVVLVFLATLPSTRSDLRR